ncbi:MAG TPA: gamma-glutamyl-gamma-aminobutyrate hydrolase family protein [Candidatus Angelobacter sp.]|nr:gamma-glutamyl-gamma-aminobutyrate hydrolase family protein [Candidatus Angelobacter sp.]
MPAKPRIAVPEPCSYDTAYSQKSLPPYLAAIESCGGEPVVLSLKLSPEEIARQIANCAAVLLPGSKADVDPQKYGEQRHVKTADADPLRDTADELLLQDAFNMRKPIFGICYGLQSLNVWRSGTLVQHIESPIGHLRPLSGVFAHPVVVEPDSLLGREAGLSGPEVNAGENRQRPSLQVNSSHHQAAQVLGDGLRAVAHCPDDGVIEAIEGTRAGHFVLAVQWHPERTFSEDAPSRKLFESFVAAAGRVGSSQ